MHGTYERTSGQVAVDHNLKNIIVQIAAIEIPVVVVGVVQKIEVILSMVMVTGCRPP